MVTTIASKMLLKYAKRIGIPLVSKKAAEYLFDKVNKKLEEEKSDRKAFQEELSRMSEEELKVYVPDVYQEDIYSIDYERLKAQGIKLISFDIDDTIDDSFLNKMQDYVPVFQVTMPDKARELFQELHAMGFTVTLLTNARAELAEATCKLLGADRYFARAHKPEPTGFQKMSMVYDVKPSQMAHVGNSMRDDVVGGNGFGVTTCLIRRAGYSLKLVKFAMKMMGLPTKGHLIRERLLERGMWRKHHKYCYGDQYYQLGEKPAYLERGEIAVVCDGKAPRVAAQNTVSYLKVMGWRILLMDADEYQARLKAGDGIEFAKVIIIGHHDLAKEQLKKTGILYNNYGMMFGIRDDVCVLRASDSVLKKEKKGNRKFGDYYDHRILDHKEIACEYGIPESFGERSELRKSQYDLLWLEFLRYGLPEFLEEGGEGGENDVAYEAAKDLIEKINADETAYSVGELLQNGYEQQVNARVETLRAHLGEDIVITGTWDEIEDMHELDESQLQEGEISVTVFNVGCYTVREAVCLYKDDDKVSYTERVPVTKQDIASYREEMSGGEIGGCRKVSDISARHNGGSTASACSGQYQGLVITTMDWSESVDYICTVKRNASAPDEEAALFVLRRCTGNAFSVEHWYRLSPDGKAEEYVIHPYDEDSFKEPWELA